MNKIILFACITLFIAFGISQVPLALNKYYDQMQQSDNIKLQNVCDRVNAREPGAPIFSASDQYAEVINEMKAKYPNLEFVNPCGFSKGAK